MSATVTDIVKAAIYCRISQDRGGEGLGVERQRALCQELAERKGWDVAEVYVDNDLSAYSGKPRPAYERMLADLRAGRRNAVVCVDQDRLTRHPAELEGFIGEADLHRWALANVSGDLNLATSEGRFRARIMGAVARQESEKKSERLRRQRDQAARKGASHGGRRPFGYEPGGQEIREAEAELVREAASRYLAGDSLHKIANDWNARGIRAASGGQWRVTSLKTMLGGARIAGLRVHHGEIIGDAAWPAIIDRETHELLVAALGDVRRIQRGRPATNLLTGMLVCGHCGGRLSMSKRLNGRRRYGCAPSPGAVNCGKLAIDAPRLEAYVAEAVLAACENVRAKPRKGTSETAKLVEVIARADDDLEALAALHGDGCIGLREWMAAREPIERRVGEARRKLAALEADSTLGDLPADVRAAWETADVDWKRRVIKAVLNSITIHPTAKRSWDPERVEFHWRA